MDRGLSRRQFLQTAAAGTTLVVAGLAAEGCDDATQGVPTFFSGTQRGTLAATVERIIPGAANAGVVNYIELLLTAFEYDPPRIYAGGPFSGRQPYGDFGTGQPSSDFPKNAFERFVPLTRMQEIAWRIRIYGSDNVQGGSFNDGALGPTKGLRTLYREGLAQLEALSLSQYGTGFQELNAEQQDEVIASADSEFVSTLVEHTLEGIYAAPEYGGNRHLVGWRENQFEGDSQPLGFSIYDSLAGEYREHPDHPMSSANPSDDPAFDDVAIEVVSAIVAGTGGERFF